MQMADMRQKYMREVILLFGLCCCSSQGQMLNKMEALNITAFGQSGKSDPPKYFVIFVLHTDSSRLCYNTLLSLIIHTFSSLYHTSYLKSVTPRRSYLPISKPSSPLLIRLNTLVTVSTNQLQRRVVADCIIHVLALRYVP